MARPAVRQERAERTRRRIIDAAASAFAERGLDGVSLNDIVKTSGLTKGAFYFHFGSKQELALAAFETKQRELLDRLAEADGSAGALSAAERLATMLRGRNRLIAADRTLACVVRLGNDLTSRAVPGRNVDDFHAPAVGVIAGLIADGMRTGEFRDDLDPTGTARAVFAWVVGTDVLSIATSGGVDLPQRAEDILTLLIPALRRSAAPDGDRPPISPAPGARPARTTRRTP